MQLRFFELINIRGDAGFIPNSKCVSKALILIGEKSRLLEGCDSLRCEKAFMENSAMDSCKIGPAVRLFSSWHGSHAVAKLSHERVAGVGRTERK